MELLIGRIMTRLEVLRNRCRLTLAQIAYRYALIALALSASLPSGAWSEDAPHLPRKFKIGFSGPLTGPAATYGLDVWTALQFAADKLGDDKFELIAQDDKCDPREGVSVAQKFVNVDHVDAVVGPVCSGPALAAAAIYERSKTLVMLTNASAEKLSGVGSYLFRTKPSDAQIAQTLWQHIKDNSQKVGILFEQTDFAIGIKDDLLRLNRDKDITLIEEGFLPATSDFRTILLRLRQQNIDGLFIMPQTEATYAVILKQIREMNWDIQLYGAHFPQSPTFLAMTDEQANGIIFAATPFVEDILNAEGRTLYQQYVALFGPMRSIELLFATTYEGFRALRDALLNSQEPRRYLHERKFIGIFGQFGFDDRCQITGIKYQLKRIKNGKVENADSLPSHSAL